MISKSLVKAKLYQRWSEILGPLLPIEKTMELVNRWYVGWSGYYQMTQYPSQLHRIEAHVRRRLRARLVDQQKRRRHLYRRLVKRGVTKRRAARAAFSHQGRWALSVNFALSLAYPVSWFVEEIGQKIRSRDKHDDWFPLRQWVRQ